MTTPSLSIGLIMPSGGPEADYYGFESRQNGAVKLYVTVSRVGGEAGHDHAISALHETGRIDWITEAAARLTDFAPDAYSWACTSGSFIKGRAFAEEQVEAIRQTTGKPASSTSLAFAAAAQSFGLHKVSVLATYPEPVSRAFQAFLGEFDIEVLSLDWLGLDSGWDAASLQADFVCERAREAKHPEAQTLLIPDTALPSLHFLDRLEAALECPVLSANAVTLWDVQRVCDRRLPCPGFGHILAAAPEEAPADLRSRL